MFAAWGDVFVSCHIVQGVALDQMATQLPKGFVLGGLECETLQAFQLNADGVVVAVGPTAIKRLASVPGALVAVDKLPEPTIALNKKCADTCRPLICW